MSDFKFALGASVILITSAAIAAENAEIERENARIDAENEDLEDGDLVLLKGFMHQIEAGEIIARSEYANGAPHQYCVRYRDGSGCQVEQWFDDSAITLLELTERQDSETGKDPDQKEPHPDD